MIDFKQFITEAKEPDAHEGHLKHIVHPEDQPFISGSKGTKHSLEALHAAHTHISKGKHDSNLTMKYDGSPAVVFGHHPQTKKFFVATKSAFNKNPKINYSHEDIEKHHGHAPGLVDKLHHALEHLPKIAPKKGIYQGDMMYSKGDVKHNKDGSASFTPNTITYTAHGREAGHVKNSKMGIVVHQKYHGNDIEKMHAKPDVDRENFKRHADVWNKSPLHDTSKTDYGTKDKLEFQKHLQAAHDIHKNNPEMYKATERHHGEAGHLATYANQTVRTGEKPTVQGLQQHIMDKHHKQVVALKTDAAKEKKKAEAMDHVNHIRAHKKHYENLLKMHGHLQNAKNVLVNTLNKDHGTLTHHIEGEKSTPEGHVYTHKDKHIKLVNRAEFSRKNLLKVRK